MEPITLCGAVVLAVGLWEEFEPIIMKITKTISRMATITSSPAAQRPLYVRYMAGMSN